MCSSIYIRFPCACIADIRGLATALSNKTRAAISRRSNYHRKRFGSGSPLTNTCYGAELIRGPERVQSFAVGSQLRKCRSRLQHRYLRMHQSRIGRLKITEAETIDDGRSFSGLTGVSSAQRRLAYRHAFLVTSLFFIQRKRLMLLFTAV